VRLAAHLRGLEGDDVEEDAIGGEQHIQAALEVLLGQLVGQIADIEPGRR